MQLRSSGNPPVCAGCGVGSLQSEWQLGPVSYALPAGCSEPGVSSVLSESKSHSPWSECDISAGQLARITFASGFSLFQFSILAMREGFGRIRHFRRSTSPGWPSNPLPIDPACKFLGTPAEDVARAQVFQNAVCNWRCWYCFVPFELLSANLSRLGGRYMCLRRREL